MRAGRGYEVSSEHRAYEEWLQKRATEDEGLNALLKVCSHCEGLLPVTECRIAALVVHATGALVIYDT